MKVLGVFSGINWGLIKVVLLLHGEVFAGLQEYLRAITPASGLFDHRLQGSPLFILFPWLVGLQRD